MRALRSPLQRRRLWTTRLLAAGVLLASVGAASAACNKTVDPPAWTGASAVTSGAGGSGDDFVGAGGDNTPPPPDAGYLCGQLITQVTKDPPNLYFVLDTSGSMAQPVGAGTRYSVVRAATIGLVSKLRGLINVGAALFPFGATGAEACAVGAQVLPTTPGDMLNPSAFSKVTNVSPFGGTPTAATLDALYPTLTQLPGRTIVVLATDGGPNCNATATCGAEDCMDNIESACDGAGHCCTPKGPSCCGADVVDGPLDCIDRQASVDAIAKLAAAGVRVYVVGVPGSETYGGVLDQMALAGGAPQIAPPFYYKVDDYSSLGGTLGSIAAIEVSCDFDLAPPPADDSLVNVYLDDFVVLQDPVDGWMWKPIDDGSQKQTIELRGSACEALKSGNVKQVQIATGCPTMVAK